MHSAQILSLTGAREVEGRATTQRWHQLRLEYERIPVLPPSSSKVHRLSAAYKERLCSPLLVIAIPLGLVILGMVLNSIGLSYDQPPSSPEQDPVKRAAAERETYRKFFNLQRSRAIKRQKRIGQYGWLLMAAFTGAFIWLYMDTVSKTTLSTQIASLQTLGTEEGKQMVLSLTLSDGSNAKYLIKLPQANKLDAASKEAVTKEKVSSWELEKLRTALSIGDSPLLLGVALKISN